jgi:BMFP domain-containing protein YqiC
MTAQDTAQELRARVAQLEDKNADLERRDERTIESVFRALVPEDVRTHLRSARKEQLLAIRAMLDHWIERCEPSDESPRRRESITVE